MSAPVIDFSVYSLNRPDRPSDEELTEVSDQVRAAMENYRMLKLKNTGMEDEMVCVQFHSCEKINHIRPILIITAMPGTCLEYIIRWVVHFVLLIKTPLDRIVLSAAGLHRVPVMYIKKTIHYILYIGPRPIYETL